MPGRLEGATFALTRVDAGLGVRLRREGARVVEFPVFVREPLGEVEPPPGPWDLAIFSSPAAVTHGLEKLHRSPTMRVAAPGPGTADCLRGKGVDPVLAPTMGSGLKSLLQLPQMADLADWRVLLVCGRPIVRRSVALLRARAAQGEVFPVYRRRVNPDLAQAGRDFEADAVDAIMVSSTGAVHALGLVFGVRFRIIPWLASSPRVARAVSRLGGRCVAVAAGAGGAAMARGAIEWWQKERASYGID